jgi:hypothetical protein
VKSNQKNLKPIANEDRLTVSEMSIEMTHTLLMTKGPEAPEFNEGKVKNFGNCITKLEYYLYNIWFFI